MQPLLLPLFPLGVVLFPGAQLPLHIFEDRYKEMIGEAIREKEEFGVVLAADKGIAHMGCTATVEQILQTYEDGRMDIVTIGRRRFEINLINEERTYLRGDVSFFDDEESEPAPLDLRRNVAELGNTFNSNAIFDPEDPRLSFTVAQYLGDLEFKQRLLSIRSEKDRVEQLAEQLPESIRRHKLTEHIRNVAPRNGHSKHF